MAWTAPATAVAGTTFTAAIFNAVRDNLNATGVAAASGAGQIIVTTAANAVTQRTPDVAFVGTTQTTASLTYVDLATTGPTVTITTGTKAIVIFGCMLSNNTVGDGARAAIDVSGASTYAASDTNSFLAESGNANDAFQGSWVTIYDPLTGGSNVFKLKYRAVGAGTASFSNRVTAIVPY